MRLVSLVAIGLLLTAGLLFATGTRLETSRANRPSNALPFADRPELSSALVATVQADQAPARIIGDLQDGADEALFGYALAAGTQTDAEWHIDLGTNDRAADRAAFGLLALGVDFERTGEEFQILTGQGPLPHRRATTQGEARTQLAAIVETSGSSSGRIFSSSDPQRLDAVEKLAALAQLETEQRNDEVWLVGRSSRLTVAGWAYTCGRNVPLVGGHDCDHPPVTTIENFTDMTPWHLATTADLDRRTDQLPPAADGGVSWTNREAQLYRPEGVIISDQGLELVAHPTGEQDVDQLPFTSGMIFQHGFGFGRYEFDVLPPQGEGLWPAIWLLDSDACDSPGRCPQYATNAYHEIDILETRGGADTFHALHWHRDQMRSAVFGSSGPDGPYTVALDRRPGLLVWSIDGTPVAWIAGPASADAGPHRTHDMMLIMNLAVGGTFSDGRAIGSTGGWRGEALVPPTFPNLDWTEARFRIGEFRLSSL